MAPAAALATRETLESLLRTRHLDTTLTSVQPWTEPVTADRIAPSGWLPLDTALGGGFPRGQLSEIVGAASSGRTSTMHRLLAAATERGELVALIDVLDRFDPESASEAGVRLDQVLWVRGRDGHLGQLALSPDWEPARARPGQGRASPMGLAVGRAIKALGLVLSSGGFGMVVLDAGDVPARALRQLPFTTWLRVQRMIEASDTSCVLVADHPLARSAGGASIRLEIGRPPEAPSPEFSSRPSFQELVRASRQPFLGPPGLSATGRPVMSRHGAGPLWSEPSSHPRRLRGLFLRASVRCGLRSTSCEGAPRR